MVKCPKCGGEMVEGEAYVNVPVMPGGSMMGGMMPIPAVSMGGIAPSEDTGLRWREKTGEKKGFLFKSEEVRTMTVKGRRCTGCGLIELYAGDEV
ncbi:MAG: hypothetical protein ABIJ47_12630 [Candidatus Bathyarchaeota archaeon]